MRMIMVFILAGFLVFLLGRMWYFYEHGVEIGRSVEQLSSEAAKAKRENEALRADYDYYQNSANIEKELRGRFNYRSPDETMIVIVPRAITSTATTTLKRP